MPIIHLKPIVHHGAPQIALYFTYSAEVKDHVKKFPGIRWSITHKAFYLLDTERNRRRIYRHLRIKKWYVDYSQLRTRKSQKPLKKLPQLSSKGLSLLNEFRKFLIGRRYSQSTVQVYTGFIRQFLGAMQGKALENLQLRDIERFMEDLIVKRGYSISSHRQLVSSLKLFLEHFVAQELPIDKLKRPKKSKFLPTVLSQEEIISLIRCTRNIKHRAIIGLLYSSGLRISELINLELTDIDIARRQVHVKQGKGRKDRYVVLSEGLLPLLQNYLQTYRPLRYFAEGSEGNRYTASSVRKFLKKSCQLAGIRKKVTPHTLRHSYATHLLENGIGLRHIQELLGHTKPETTMIYTHVAKKDLLDIRSPLDQIILDLTKNSNETQNFRLSPGKDL